MENIHNIWNKIYIYNGYIKELYIDYNKLYTIYKINSISNIRMIDQELIRL